MPPPPTPFRSVTKRSPEAVERQCRRVVKGEECICLPRLHCFPKMTPLDSGHTLRCRCPGSCRGYRTSRRRHRPSSDCRRSGMRSARQRSPAWPGARVGRRAYRRQETPSRAGDVRGSVGAPHTVAGAPRRRRPCHWTEPEVTCDVSSPSPARRLPTPGWNARNNSEFGPGTQLPQGIEARAFATVGDAVRPTATNLVATSLLATISAQTQVRMRPCASAVEAGRLHVPATRPTGRKVGSVCRTPRD